MSSLAAVVSALRWDYVLTIALMLLGLDAMLLKRNLVKKLIGMNVFQGAIILFYIFSAYKVDASVPIWDAALGDRYGAYMNPIPHGLMLTAIVVSVATTGVGLGLLIVIHRRYGTLNEDDLLRKLRDEAPDSTAS